MSDLVQSMNNFLNQQTWLDQAAKPVQRVVNKIFTSGGAVSQKLADLLNGTWLGHPLHPVLTDIPIGAWMVAVTLDAMDSGDENNGVARAADAAVALGVAGAAGSAITGLADWQHTVGESRRTGFLHATLNVLALGLFVYSLFARRSRDRELGRSLALAGFTVASASAYLGGDLVYRQKIGVNHAPEAEEIEAENFVPVLAEELLPENQLTVTRLADIPLVLLRRGDQIFALAETCAHMGGPLADGRVYDNENGDPVVVCPWHSSNFNMASGDIVHGPTSYPQPCFEARIRDGQVEVRLRSGQ